LRRNWLHLILLAACWAPSFLFIKLALTGGVPPLAVAAGRVALAAVILAAVLAFRRQPFPRDAASWRAVAPMALLSTAIPFALFSLGERHADSGMAAILNGTTPIFTVILAQVFLHDERLTAQTLTGVLIGFAGILLIFGPEVYASWTSDLGEESGLSARALGLAQFTVAGACYGAANVYARRHLRDLPPMVTPTLQMTMAAAVLLGVTSIAESPLAARPDAAALGSVVVLGVFGTALAYMLYYPLMVRTSATFVSLVTYLLPPAGVVLGMVFLAEQPGWHDLIGCALIIVGVAVVNAR